VRIAWFSPFPPERSGIAAYSAELLPLLDAVHAIDRVSELGAHDFVWKHRRDPYDLVVYQLGNAPCHDYMWAYLATYPGLVVLHDGRLHHARARRLLKARRFDDYRREFAYDHPDAPPEVTEFAVEGLGGSIYYFWSMLRVVMRTARLVAVHNVRVAADLRNEYPETTIEAIRMGVPFDSDQSKATSEGDRAAVRRALGLPDGAIVFAAFGKVTPEKRIETILRALEALVDAGRDAWLLVVGDADAHAPLAADLARLGVRDRVRVTGHVPDAAIGAHLAAADVCLCLRWPTAEETSAAWLRCLAAGRPTVLSDLAHLVDVPLSVALRVDLVDEDVSLVHAMERLADDRTLREDLGRAGHAYWEADHTLQAMADDYLRLLPLAAARLAPAPTDLPAHFTEDHGGPAREIARRFGVSLDILE
jgi:glycosyltransferase involved in cell wall biosynthesis